MFRLYDARFDAEAQMLLAVLRAAGFDAMFASDEGAVLSGLPPGRRNPHAIWLRSAPDSREAKEARALVLRSLQPIHPERCPECDYDLRSVSAPRCPECGTPFRPRLEEWRCANCGESIEGQFTDCWHCGAGRPKREAGKGGS